MPLGLQLFGAENVAIIKIRYLTNLTSIISSLLMVGYFGTPPPIFSFFYGLEGRSLYDEIRAQCYKTFYAC
jgi:hypothetical protein